MGNEKEKKELKINIKVKPFPLHYEDSHGKPYVKAVSELEITTDPGGAENASKIVSEMFFNTKAGRTIPPLADFIDNRYESIREYIKNTQNQLYVVGQNPRQLLSSLRGFAPPIARNLMQKFKDQYSKITIDVS